jgi:hypothetical protein
VLVTYKTAPNLVYPVYQLESSNWSLIDGILFLDNRVLDDTNMPGDTLGKRRLQTPFNDLVPLKKAAFSFLGIIKNTNKFFIDNSGMPFIYQKTKVVPLKYYKIKEVQRKESRSLLWLHNINYSFQLDRPPPPAIEWAGVLHLNNFPWLLYDYSANKLKSTRRKI